MERCLKYNIPCIFALGPRKNLQCMITLAECKKIREEKKIFLISPVQNVPPEVMTKIEKYVKELEDKGYDVFWPIRDNPYQKTDLVGIDILDLNSKKILDYPKIHIWYLSESTGSHFDIGEVYMLIKILKHKKEFVFANKDEFADVIKKPEKSFPRVLDFLERQTK